MRSLKKFIWDKYGNHVFIRELQWLKADLLMVQLLICHVIIKSTPPYLSDKLISRKSLHTVDLRNIADFRIDLFQRSFT